MFKLDPQLTESLQPARFAMGMLWLLIGAAVGCAAAFVATYLILAVAFVAKRYKLVSNDQIKEWQKNTDWRLLQTVMMLAAAFCGLLLSHFQSLMSIVYCLGCATWFLFINMLLIS